MILPGVCLIVFTIARVSSSSSSSSVDDLFQPRSPIYHLAEVATREYEKVKTPCKHQLKNIFYGATKQEKWALKLVRASGSPTAAALWGDNYWLGTHNECRLESTSKENVNSFENVTNSANSENQPFDVAYYIALFHQNLSLISEFDAKLGRVIHLGLCLPSVCSVQELNSLLTLWGEQFTDISHPSSYNTVLKFQNVRLVQSNVFSWVYNSPVAVTLLCFFAIVALLTISGTIYDVYIWTPKVRDQKAFNNLCKNNEKTQNALKARNIRECSELLTRDNNLNECYELKIDNFQHKSIPIHVVKETPNARVEEVKQGFLGRLSLCFSLSSNFKFFSGTTERNNELSIIYGFRFFGLGWLMWLYASFYARFPEGNKHLLYSFSNGYSEHVMSKASYPIDMLFFASGFLLSYKYYRQRRGSINEEMNFSIKKSVNEFSVATLMRFFRLTPMYGFFIAAFIVSVKGARQTSLMEVGDAAEETCRKTWWRNVAYINNLFNGHETCVPWSWYLSADMQFFIFGLFVLILSTRFWKFTVFLSGGIIVLSSFITGYYGNLLAKDSPTQPESRLLDIVYTSPWTRVEPHLIGMLTGYFLVHLKGELKVKRITLVACWIMTVICTVWALFGLRDKMSVVLTTLHFALGRIAWSFSLSCVAITCSNGNSGVIKSSLERFRWPITNKLFYSAYLLSPLFITLLASNSEMPMYMDYGHLVVYFIGCLVTVYFVAFLVTLTLEIPLVRIAKRTIGSQHAQNQLNQASN